MNRELETAYHTLAEAIENAVREPGCEEEIAIRALELYVDLIARLVPSPSMENFQLTAGSCGVSLNSRPSTAYEAMEIFARLRAEYMDLLAREPVMVH